MKSFSAFFLGGLTLLVLLGAYFLGRISPDLRASLDPIPGAQDVGTGSGWRLGLEYQPLVPAMTLSEAPDEIVPTRVPLEEPAARRRPRLKASDGAPARVPGSRQNWPGEPTLRSATRAPADPVEVSEGPELLGWHPNGERSYVGQQVHDPDRGWLRDGDWQAWHENGARHELGAYRDGGEHGPWEWWYDNGRPMAEGHFEEGRRVGAWRFWHDNGQLQMTGQYQGGVGTGLWTHYYTSGAKKAQGLFENGKPSGEWTVWTPRGRRDEARSGEYLAGVRID